MRHCEKFVYKYSETIEHVKKLAYFSRNLQTSRANNWRILRIKNAKFSGFCFYINRNILRDFQICTSAPLKNVSLPENFRNVLNEWSLSKFLEEEIVNHFKIKWEVCSTMINNNENEDGNQEKIT